MKETEKERSNRRYREGKLNPEWMKKKRMSRRLSAERSRRRRGAPRRTTDLEQIRRTRRAKEARYWKRSVNRRISMNLRARMRLALKSDARSGRTAELLGCSMAELRGWLESKFQPGMSWQNYGPIWHIDHRRPCSWFDLSDPLQQRVCFHWTNLQPMYASENLRKGARVSLGE